MSAHDQCPSSKKSGKPGKAELAAMRRELPTLAGRASQPVWRSLDEAADDPAFREKLEREFPSGASEMLEPATRRTFLKLMGAGVALAGAATVPGCRRPDHKIMPYARNVPEEIIPGKPLFYATSMPLPGGGAEGLLVETHEGRPTKIEGNPLHPINRGKSTVWAQASVLNMYDPDRLKFPVYQDPAKGISARNATWDDFRLWAKDHFGQFDSTRGKGLAFVVEKKTGPSREAMRQRILQRFPQAMWVPYDATESDSAAQGTTLAFGRPMRELLSLSENGRVKAKVILSLDRDFLEQTDPGMLVNQREFASTRRMLTTSDEMSRLYVAEPQFSITGSCADHRLRVAPSRLPALAVAVAKAVIGKAQGLNVGPLAQALDGVNAAPGEDLDPKWIDAVADDLLFEADEHGGKRTRAGETLILAGPTQPAAVHALCAALNAALGNIGKTVSYVEMTPDEASSSVGGITEVSRQIEQGAVTTVVFVCTNPVYDAPADLAFADKLKRVTSVTLSVELSETALASNWCLNGAHYLEAWGDTEAIDGTVAPIQPAIAPLYAPALSEIELLALIADPNAAIMPEAPATPPAAAPGAPPAPKMARVDDGYQIVRAAWRARLGGGVNDTSFEKMWKRALHDGMIAHGAFARPLASVQPDFGRVAGEVAKIQAAPAPTEQSLDVLFTVGQVHDGRYANNAWLQELPQTGTRVVWDNPALVSPKTAEKLGLLPDKYRAADPESMYADIKYPSGRRATITVNGRSMEIAVWLMPGMADNTVALTLGYGRGSDPKTETCGRVGAEVGFNTYLVRDGASRRTARGATLKAADGWYPVSSTQNNWSMEGRTSLARQVDLVAWKKFGDAKSGTITEPDRVYRVPGMDKTLSFGERVGGGELSHTPANLSIYPNPYNFTPDPNRPGSIPPDQPHAVDGNIRGKSDKPEPGSVYAGGNQWGMMIDLATCTGCGTCTIACQAENNIAVVGKKEVAKNREMHWIRVDRYFTGEINEPSRMMHQPVPCMHCENAPCETVCPVNATVHGPEGINYQVYNRCIGTRYCENNCPYKVRRFNFFDYGVTKFNGDYYFKDIIEEIPAPSSHGNGPTKYNKHNPNLVPPRLRQKLDEITRMQKNPNVTVRSRGVMEKCTYCIQRVNEARIEAKLQDLKFIPDGFVQAACQQACPSNAIVFGDLNDTQSNNGAGSVARQWRNHQRSYMLLGYLDTLPRTMYMVGVQNPNPRLRTPVENPFHHEGGEGGGGEGKGEHAGAGFGPGISRAAFLRDSAKKAADRGYALSLRVLGSIGM